MTKTHRLQANLNEMTDDQIQQFLFYHYHRIKDIEASKQNDPTIQRLKQELKEAEAFYNQELRSCKNNINAARAICGIRGISISQG